MNSSTFPESSEAAEIVQGNSAPSSETPRVPVDAPPSHGRGRRFNPCRAHHSDQWVSTDLGQCAPVQKNIPGHFLYAVRSGDHVKIGRARDVAKRLIGLQTGSPTPVALVHSVRIHPDLISEAEKLAHKMHGDRWVRGEWFAISDAEAGTCLDAVAGQMARHESYLDWKPSLAPDPAFSALNLALKMARGETLSSPEREEVKRIVGALPTPKP